MTTIDWFRDRDRIGGIEQVSEHASQAGISGRTPVSAAPALLGPTKL